MTGSLFDVPDVKAALWLLLGGGLDENGKNVWLAWRLTEEMSPEAIFADALKYVTA